MVEGKENIINFQERAAEKVRELFNGVAMEIRDGTLQLHFTDNTYLFTRTDEILYFALEGEKLTFDSIDYKERLAEVKQEIQKNADMIVEALPRYPKNDCPAVRESIGIIESLLQKIRV